MKCLNCKRPVEIVYSQRFACCTNYNGCGWGTKIENLSQEQLKSLKYSELELNMSEGL